MSGMVSGDLAQLDALRKTFGDQVQAVDAGRRRRGAGLDAKNPRPGGNVRSRRRGSGMCHVDAFSVSASCRRRSADTKLPDHSLRQRSDAGPVHVISDGSAELVQAVSCD